MKVNYTKELLEEKIKDCYSFAELCRRLGLNPEGSNPKTLRKKLDLFGIDYSHFTGQGWNVGLQFKPRIAKSLDLILTKNSTYQSYKLLKRLITEGKKERKCECCDNTEWNGNKIPLELHHINGIRTDNRLENLQVLCPNCHALTDNYRGKKNQIVESNSNHKRVTSTKESAPEEIQEVEVG